VAKLADLGFNVTSRSLPNAVRREMEHDEELLQTTIFNTRTLPCDEGVGLNMWFRGECCPRAQPLLYGHV